MKITINKLPQLKQEKVREVNQAFERAAAALTADYPPTEKLTWPVQEREALAWRDDPNASTPYLDDLANLRGLTRQDMLTRTLHQVLYFQEQSKQLVGRRQFLIDQINGATTAAELANIAWEE